MNFCSSPFFSELERNGFILPEKNLSQLCEKMLMVVAIKYDKDSREYEMAGGVRNSDRVRKIRATRLKSAAEKASDENIKTD